MLIFSPHNWNLCLESQETRFLWNIFEAVQETRSTCFIGIKTLCYASCFYTPIKHCHSFFKHYLTLQKGRLRLHVAIWAYSSGIEKESGYYILFSKIVMVTFENVCWLAYETSSYMKKALEYNVYHHCLCYFLNQAMMA